MSQTTDDRLGDALELRRLAACAIAREAGALIRERFLQRDSVLKLSFKGPQDYLTQTDGEVEQLIRERLASAFPRDAFFGEEGGGSDGSRLWIVDPIDGTADFARGVAHFCVSIAFVQDGKLTIGVIFDPMADELFVARHGRGATLNGAPIRVSGTTDPAKSVVEAGWSFRLPLEPYLEFLTRLRHLGASAMKRGSGALGIAYVAAGRQDAYCEQHINSYDAAAAVLLVQEAGGWTNDFLTPDCLTKGNWVIACTPALQDTLVTAMDIKTSGDSR